MMPMAALARKSARGVSPLAVLLLSACGGGGSDTSISHNTHITTSAGRFKTASTVDTPEGAPSQGISYPIGWITFTIVDVPVGGTALVKFTFPTGTDPSGYIKYLNGSFTTLGSGDATVDGNTLTLRLVDGGPLDADGLANGTIVDPGAPFIIAGSSSSSSSSGAGSSSSSSSSSGAASSSSSSGTGGSSGASSSGSGTGSSSGAGSSSSSSGVASSSSGASAQVQTLYSFQVGTDGNTPAGGVLQGSDGNFYGTTEGGGANQAGTVFKLTSAGVETILYSFKDTAADAAYPDSPLVQGKDGAFYGVAHGTADTGSQLATTYGAVFKITASGSFTSLYTFTGGADGYDPRGLMLGSDGNFYGTTKYSRDTSGNILSGTVFKITPTGTLTTLHSFTGGADGAYPFSGLVQGSDGSFYGTTSQGGANGIGAVYKITSAGALTTLYSFGGAADGYFPTAPLVQGSDGNFYGSTFSGGNSAGGSNGTLFRITPAGSFTTLHAFAGEADGGTPEAGLVRAADGFFYGITDGGGTISNGAGVLYRLGSDGSFAALYDFTTNPTVPSALIAGSDGKLYGSNITGGSANAGLVFSVSLSH